MADTRLETFVGEALREGASREATERVLIQSGWSKDQVTSALGNFAATPFAVPVPRPRSQLSARDAFLYLVMFSMLYCSAFHFGTLVFQFINMVIPDPASGTSQWAEQVIRWSTSVVVVTVPIFLFVSRHVSSLINKDPTLRTSAVRKWLTYMTLAIAACVVAGDLVVLVNSVLSGELTARFVLKSLTVGVIAGGIFCYYFLSMRADDEANSNDH